MSKIVGFPGVVLDWGKIASRLAGGLASEVRGVPMDQHGAGGTGLECSASLTLTLAKSSSLSPLICQAKKTQADTKI